MWKAKLCADSNRLMCQFKLNQRGAWVTHSDITELRLNRSWLTVGQSM